MKRRHFSKSSLITTVARALSPNYIIGQTNSELPYEELIGKGKPFLYGTDYKLRLQAHIAFRQMQVAAKKSDISIKIVSSYRSYDHQKRIWERKFKRNRALGLTPIENMKKIIEYSTIPGTSRHHWGTEIDIVDGRFMNTPNLLSAKNFEQGQPFHELKLWLHEYANAFGFYLAYTDTPSRKGFKYEPWHLSFKPLSKGYLKTYRTLDILKTLQAEKFVGSEYFTTEFINSYIDENILDINPELLH